MNNLIDKINQTSITYSEVLFNFFVPVGKLSGNSKIAKDFAKNGNRRVVKTPYGTMEIRNRLLTEYHQSIINAIFHLGELRVLEDGNIASFFKEADILNALNMGNNPFGLRETIKRIKDTQYYIPVGGYTRSVSIFMQHLLTNQKLLKHQVVVFDPEYIKLFRNDFSVDYRKRFDKIISMPYATIPSIIKYLFVKSKMNTSTTYDLETVLKDLGFPIESVSSFREIKSNLKQYAETLEKDYNIIYDYSKKTFKFEGLEEIVYIDRLESSIENLDSYIDKIIKYEDGDYPIRKIIQGENIDEWIIKTDSDDIRLHSPLSELLFLLEKTTK